MKSILKVLLNWKNWNNREVGNTYRFVSEDNFLFVEAGGSFMEQGTVTVKATIGGVEQEITRSATFAKLAIDNVTPGTPVVVSWEGKVLYLQVNEDLLFGELPERQYRYQTKVSTIDVEKSTGDGTVIVSYVNTISESRTVQLDSSTPVLHVTDAKIGSAVSVGWERTISYLKVNDKVLVG